MTAAHSNEPSRHSVRSYCSVPHVQESEARVTEWAPHREDEDGGEDHQHRAITPVEPVGHVVGVQVGSREEDLAALHDASDDAAQEHDHDADLREQLQGTYCSTSVSSNANVRFLTSLPPLHFDASSR